MSDKIKITPSEIYANAIMEFGVDAQIDMLHEEVGELLSAINKYKRGRVGNEDVITEIADVMIMCGQMAFVFGPVQTECEMKRKLVRIQQRIDERRKQNKTNKQIEK